MTSTTVSRAARWAAIGTTLAATALLIGCSTTGGGTPTGGTTTSDTTTSDTTGTIVTGSGTWPDRPTVLTKIPTTLPTNTSGIATGPTVAPSPPKDPGPPLQIVDDAELVAIVGEPGLIGWRGFSRITDNSTLEEYEKSLTMSDGTAHGFVDAVDGVPEGKVLVVGPVTIGCDVPGGAALATDGASFVLVPTDLPASPTPECFVAVVTIAAVAVDPDTVKAGTVGVATSVDFSRVDEPKGSRAVELTEDPQAIAELGLDGPPDLAPPGDGLRRFAFVLTGCQESAAAIEIDNDRIGARLDPQDPATEVLCDAPEYYLAVFDVSEQIIPPTAELEA